jgi:hypothetical protein
MATLKEEEEATLGHASRSAEAAAALAEQEVPKRFALSREWLALLFAVLSFIIESLRSPW